MWKPSLVAKMTSMRILVPLAAIYHWPLCQLDIKNVFLNGILDESLYREPLGFIAQGESTKVCRLKKSLYDLKQSPGAQFGHFASVQQQ